MAGADEPKAAIEAVAPAVDAPVAVKAIKTGKASEVDIAAQILADYADTMGSEGWTEEEEKKLMRKVDWWLIPIVSVPLYRRYTHVQGFFVSNSLALCLRHTLWPRQDGHLGGRYLRHQR